MLLLFLTLYTTFYSAETWTSVKGKKPEHEFISDSASAEKISIKRAYDNKVFAMLEVQLIHTNRIKAIRQERVSISGVR